MISGGAVAVGQLLANGGNRGGNPGYGSAAAGVSITSAGALSVDEVEAFGGNSTGDGYAGGAGGQIVLNGDGIFTSELRTTPGSSTGNSPGGQGGLIVVNGRSAVTILGGVFANGANATGGAPWGGGAGANVTLHAIAGPLALLGADPDERRQRRQRAGGVKAGAGGPGGSVDLVGTPIDPIAGISTEGGDGGTSNNADNRGVGGNGGSDARVVGDEHLRTPALDLDSRRRRRAARRRRRPAAGLRPDRARGRPDGPAQLQLEEPVRRGLPGHPHAGRRGRADPDDTSPRRASRLPPVDALRSGQLPGAGVPERGRLDIAAHPRRFRSSASRRRPSAAPMRRRSARDSKVIVKRSTLAKAKGALVFTVQTNGLGSVTATASTKGAKKPLAPSPPRPRSRRSGRSASRSSWIRR